MAAFVLAFATGDGNCMDSFSFFYYYSVGVDISITTIPPMNHSVVAGCLGV